jgi:hypothetical protein
MLKFLDKKAVVIDLSENVLKKLFLHVVKELSICIPVAVAVVYIWFCFHVYFSFDVGQKSAR